MPIREFVELGARAQKAAKVLEEVAAKLKPIRAEEDPTSIALMAAVQQAVMLARAAARLALWGVYFELEAADPVDPAAARSSNG